MEGMDAMRSQSASLLWAQQEGFKVGSVGKMRLDGIFLVAYHKEHFFDTTGGSFFDNIL